MKLPNESLRSAFRVFEPLTNCTPDFSLHAAPVKPTKEGANVGVEQELVPVENTAFLKHRIDLRIHRSNLYVLAGVVVDSLS